MTRLAEWTDARSALSERTVFPEQTDHERRWAELAAAIASERSERSDDPRTIRPPDRTGELIVLGSGIEAGGFSETDEAILRGADRVFFCVADPATEVWIKTLRPDSYDLYVLYGENKKRYVTYMEMTEAILHYVRHGETVAAIYYGHPGVFVLSTHRAIRIARREGHRAVMRPAVSALDALCADLGVDPSQPGLQTFEATDMLIHRRRPDPTVHVVLWQVGLIGELGYRRQGFLNQGFDLLLDYLDSIYGAEQPVVHYIGSRYPGVDPVIERHSVAALRQPATQSTVTGISTFYLPPTQVAELDTDVLLRLGLLRPGQTATAPASPLRAIDRYGRREAQAFDDLAKFRVPGAYHWQEDTPSARFVLALRHDPELCQRYRRDPSGTVAAWTDPQLRPAERALLAKRDGGSVQLAAKGLEVGPNRDLDRLLTRLLTRKAEARGLLRHVREASPVPDKALAERPKIPEGWGPGLRADWTQLSQELDRFARRTLIPWTGLYSSDDKEHSVLVLARSAQFGRDQVWLDGVAVSAARYGGGVIRWRGPDGNATNGYLRTDMSRGGRCLIGSIWPDDETPGSRHRFVAVAQRLPDAHGSSGHRRPELAGSYRVRVGSAPSGPVVPFVLGAGSLSIGGVVPATVEHNGNGIWRWQAGSQDLPSGEVTAAVDPITGHPMLFGTSLLVASGSRQALTGMIPVQPSEIPELEATPRLGLALRPWAHLLSVAVDASTGGGLSIWHSWHTSVLCWRLLRAAIREATA